MGDLHAAQLAVTIGGCFLLSEDKELSGLVAGCIRLGV
jgi:hypothetical protein